MNMRMRPIAIIVFIGIVTALANAGPFGIEMGMTLQQIESLSGAAAKEFGIGYEIQPPKRRETYQAAQPHRHIAGAQQRPFSL